MIDILQRWVLFFSVILLSACVTRTGFPELHGSVYDEAGQPIVSAQVCANHDCVQTDREGRFFFARRTYIEMIQIGGEAPPIHYKLAVTKDGYQAWQEDIFLRYGGGSPKKTMQHTIVLKKEN